MRLSDSRLLMIKALKKLVVPYLREHGFKGSFPHFRRQNEEHMDVITFQFNRYGGSFVVEVAICGKDGFTTSWGQKIPANKVTTYDLNLNDRCRLRENTKKTGYNDPWFYYEEAKTDEDFEQVASKVQIRIQGVSDYNWIKKLVSLNEDWE
ncbi:DUF4304 domain-containing protein [Lysinibacillus sp. NPDC097195]|uniref:DUF4304 domain-containing protein n=1 Tax=Lysinibacillus sp. NPDC097195 TaxID=3364141 RepID=UPI003827123F